jgi:hypothetical protein
MAGEKSWHASLCPQEDIVERTETVRENLAFRASALVHELPDSRPDRPSADAAAAAAVDTVMHELKLCHVADVVIGEEGSATGISGGQLRRCSVGCELVSLLLFSAAERAREHAAGPGPILLLDEPTSGLDPASSAGLTRLLRRLTRGVTGVTVLATLHQLRRASWVLIDYLLVLAPPAGSQGDARVVYCGPRDLALPYIMGLDLGYVPPPPADCIADWLLDIVSGLQQPGGRSGVVTGGKGAWRIAAPPDDLPALWTGRRGREVFAELKAQARAQWLLERMPPPPPDAAPDSDFHGASCEDTLTSAHGSRRPRRSCGASGWVAVCGWIRQARLQASRVVVGHLRGGHSLVMYALLHVLGAVICATGFTPFLQGSYSVTFVPPAEQELIAFFPGPFKPRSNENSWDLPLVQLLFFLAMLAGGAAGLSSIGLFAGHLALLRREVAAGLYSSAAACGRIAGETMFVVWGALVFTGVWLLFAPAGPWHWYLGTITAYAYACSGLGYIVSLLTRRPADAAVALTLLLTVLSTMGAGVEPRLAVMRRLAPGLEYLLYASPAFWSAEAVYTTWTSVVGDPERVQRGADEYGFTVNRGPTMALFALLVLGSVYRVCAAVLLWRRTRAAVASTSTAWARRS